MVGFYEERIISILDYSDSYLTAKDIWREFEDVYRDDLKKLRGKSKEASFHAALSVLRNKPSKSKLGVRRIVKKNNMQYNIGHYYIKRDMSYYANILLNLRDS